MAKQQVEIKQLAGSLNLDDPIEDLGKVFHRDSTGIYFEGTPPNRRVRVLSSNEEIVNSLLPATGTNKTICQKYDSKNNRLFFLNYNSLGKHGIYVYNRLLNTFQRLVEVGVNTAGDPLQFTGESHVNIDIIYGDSTQGDILYFVDSLGRPTKINIARALAGGYGSIQRSFMDVAKEPAPIPPAVVYEYDAANTVNNLRKKLFRFKIRWVFDDQDKAVTSSQSEMALPWNSFEQAYDANPAANCRLAIVFQTGAANVKKIEILGAVSLGNVLGDFFLIESIDKQVAGLSDNDLATYLFYNDKAYDNIDVKESIQLFDYVPLAAQAQTLLNGNVLSYGNITEGYPNLTNFSFGGETSNVASAQVPSYSGNTYSKLVATQSGDSGFGTGNIHIVVRGLIVSIAPILDTYTVYMTDGTNVTYTLSNGDDAAAVIEGLRVDAISKGYTIVSNGSNDLTIQKTNISLARVLISSTYQYVALFNSSVYAYDWLGSHGWGLVYFDAKGRTNGVVFTRGFSVNSPSYTESGGYPQKPAFVASIYHAPPDWAYYYQWVRTKDLKKSSFIQWITDRTYKDNTTASGITRYAYLSIESLNTFIAQNPGTPLIYGFTSGDRITFIKRYNADNSTANMYGNSKDYEVTSSVINPTINGQVRTGQFIKIILPDTDGSFDFGDGFNNYFIELYTPAQSVANGLDVYYEYGERYAIGSPGTANRFHQGMNQNQIANTTTPAIFTFINGDFYIKSRSVQTGNVFTFRETADSGEADRVLFGMNFIGQTYDDPNITAQSVPLTGLTPSFNPGSDTRWILKAIDPATFRIKGTLYIQFTTAKPGDFWQIFLQNRYGEITFLVPAFDAGDAKVYSFTIDDEITLEDDRIFLQASSIGFGSRPVAFLDSEITFTIDRTIPQAMIDPNFSDYFPSAVNSNGRSFPYEADAAQITYPNMYRWSLAYQTDTNINQTCRFYPENFDETNRRHGAIRKMAQLESELIFFLEKKIGHTGVFQKFITDNSGNSQLVTTNSIITQNNIQYYKGEIGVGNQPTAVVQSDYVFYGVDTFKNIIWRLSLDGVTDLSELYKVKSWASTNLPKYLSPGNYPFGGSQKVLGTFNLRPDNVGEYLLLAQGASTAGETFAFEERYNSFYGRLPIDCDAIVCAENMLFMFKNGKLWKRSTTVTKNNFFGTQYEPSILIPFNGNMAIKKIFNAISYQASSVWGSNTAGDVETNTVSSQTALRQQSRIMVQDYDSLENPNRYASFNRNINSTGSAAVSLWEGEYLTGHYIIVRLRSSTTGDNYLFSPYIVYELDPRNL